MQECEGGMERTGQDGGGCWSRKIKGDIQFGTTVGYCALKACRGATRGRPLRSIIERFDPWCLGQQVYNNNVAGGGDLFVTLQPARAFY